MPFFHLLVVVAEDELNLRSQEVCKILSTLARSPRTAQDIVALEGGPQPGGVVYPSNPRGWLPEEVQVIPQIYSWSKNTRDLEWFGPPERNTLRPLRVVLLLCLWMILSSASQSFSALSPSLTGISLL